MLEHSTLSRRRLLALAGTGTATGLAGCFGTQNNGNGSGNGNGNGGGQNQSDDTGTPDPASLPPVHMLTDFNNKAWQKKWDEQLIPQFKEQTGIDIKMEYAGFSGGGQEQRLATLLQSGDPPGLSEGTFEQLADVWASDALAPTTDAVNKITELAGKPTAKLFKDADGDTFMFPHGYYTSVFHYRKDVYEELGLEVPRSFQGLLDNAKAIDESDMDIRGYGLAATKGGKSQDEYQVFLANMGASGLRIKEGTMENDVPEAELWFPKKEMVTLLEYQKQLAQYSSPPSNIGWGNSLKGWASGEFAQQYNLNMWPAGVAAGVDENIAKNTGVAPLPLWEEGGITKEDSWLSNPAPDGHFPYKNADNTPGAFRWMMWLYGEDMSRTARMYETEPTRFLPIYGKVLDSDAYQGFDHWGTYPSHLDGLKKCQNSIIPEYYNNVKESLLLSTRVPEAAYFARFFFLGEMVNQVVVANKDPEAAWQQTKEKAKQRLQEGKQKLR